MSIKVTSLVWDGSVQEGTGLLVMLAIADFADDEGMAFPGMTRIAQKARISVRYLHNVLDKLVASGELAIDKKNGVKTQKGQRTNRYLINVEMLKGEAEARDKAKRGEPQFTPSVEKEVNPSSPLDEKEVNLSSPPLQKEVNPSSGLSQKEVIPSSPKPSVKIQPPVLKDQPSVFTAWLEAFGKPVQGPLLAEELMDMESEFGLEAVKEAFRETALSGARAPMKYARAILVRQTNEKITGAGDVGLSALAATVINAEDKNLSINNNDPCPKPWEIVVNQLTLQLGPQSGQWLRGARVLRVDEDPERWVIGCETSAQLQQLKYVFGRSISRIMRAVAGHEVEIEYVKLDSAGVA